MPQFFDLLYNQVLNSNQYDQVVFYEFGGNFWFYGDQIEYKGNDNKGVVTTGYAVYMRFKAMDAVGVQGAPYVGSQTVPLSQLRQTIAGLVDEYEANPSLNWSNTLEINQAPSNSLNLNGSDLFASFCMRLERDYGGDAFVNKLWKAVGQQPAASNTQDALRNFVTAASSAAGQDLTPLFRDQWRWPI